MKIAVTSTGKDLGSEVDPRFGRASYLLIVDSETLDFEVIDNMENKDSFKGAGIQAAGLISKSGAKILLTGYCGPNAFKALKAAKIGVANDAKGTIKESVEAYMDGKLPLTDESNVKGHW